MSADAERALLTRAEELAETTDIADEIITLIARARRARVDQSALSGPVAAVRALDGNPFRLMAAALGRTGLPLYRTDAALIADGDDIEDELSAREKIQAALMTAAIRAFKQARDDAERAAEALEDARAMAVKDECDGCHEARAAAIDAAIDALRDARDRAGLAKDAFRTLRRLRFHAARAAMERLPGDLQAVYEAVYDLVATDPHAMPSDGDFITGEQPAP